MTGFMQKCSEKGEKCCALAWQLISFLALGADEQIAAAGSSKQWFFMEDSAINPGANYFYGIALILHEIRGCRYFSDWSPTAALKLEEMLSSLVNTGADDIWTPDALQNSEIWRQVRELAK
jgi:hypothetical protein